MRESSYDVGRTADDRFAIPDGARRFQGGSWLLGWFYQHVSSIVQRFFGRFERETGFNFPVFVVIEGSFVPGPAVTSSASGVQSPRSDPLLLYLVASHAVLLALAIAIVIAKAF